MPTFYSTSVKIHLSVSDLAWSTNAADARRANFTKSKDLTGINSHIAAGERLAEHALDLPDDPGRLHFLGNHADIPFYIVHAGEGLFTYDSPQRDASRSTRGSLTSLEKQASSSSQSMSAWTPEQSSSNKSIGSEDDVVLVPTNTAPSINNIANGIRQRRALRLSMTSPHTLRLDSSRGRNSLEPNSKQASLSPTMKTFLDTAPITQAAIEETRRKLQTKALLLSRIGPRALTLTVAVAPESFLCTFDDPKNPQDLRIDVFLNGEFSGSSFLPSRWRREANKRCEFTQRFSGRRVDRLMEHPWVLVPCSQNVDGTLRRMRRGRNANLNAKDRWSEIGLALEEEGRQRGVKGNGEMTVLGEYLTSLARLPMPEKVEGLQKRGGPKYGVLDVVVVLGRGRKYDPQAQYQKGPVRMLDPRFPPPAQAPTADDISPGLTTTVAPVIARGPNAGLARLPALKLPITPLPEKRNTAVLVPRLGGPGEISTSVPAGLNGEMAEGRTANDSASATSAVAGLVLRSSHAVKVPAAFHPYATPTRGVGKEALSRQQVRSRRSSRLQLDGTDEDDSKSPAPNYAAVQDHVNGSNHDKDVFPLRRATGAKNNDGKEREDDTSQASRRTRSSTTSSHSDINKTEPTKDADNVESKPILSTILAAHTRTNAPTFARNDHDGKEHRRTRSTQRKSAFSNDLGNTPSSRPGLDPDQGPTNATHSAPGRGRQTRSRSSAASAASAPSPTSSPTKLKLKMNPRAKAIPFKPNNPEGIHSKPSINGTEIDMNTHPTFAASNPNLGLCTSTPLGYLGVNPDHSNGTTTSKTNQTQNQTQVQIQSHSQSPAPTTNETLTSSKTPHNLSDDCILTYAPETPLFGTTLDVSRRQIRPSRGGEFLEASVLVGVRYVLG